MPFTPDKREYRSFGNFETGNEEQGDKLMLRGVPIVFNRPTVLWEMDGIEYKEVIEPGALEGCDMSDFILNRNHGMNDGTVYARTRNGSLCYEITPSEVYIEADLDPEDERHKNLHRDVIKGRVDKMSFSFIPRECSYDRETHTRTIRKIKKLYDVSAVDFPAYNDTSLTTARDFFSEEHQKEFKALEQAARRRRLALALKINEIISKGV